MLETIEKEEKIDELEQEIIFEILREGRGEREERGERDEWNQHVGWHRKEDVGLQHPKKQDHKDKRAITDNKRSDHAMEETVRHNAGKQKHHGRNQHIRKRNSNRTGLSNDSGLDHHGTETGPLRSSGVWAILAAVFLLFFVWWRNKSSFLGSRRRIRKRDAKGRTL